ncbi:MAG: hypothetical protein QW594_03935, partial [Candidatus Woesearchaeota archaeon]
METPYSQLLLQLYHAGLKKAYNILEPEEELTHFSISIEHEKKSAQLLIDSILLEPKKNKFYESYQGASAIRTRILLENQETPSWGTITNLLHAWYGKQEIFEYVVQSQ